MPNSNNIESIDEVRSFGHANVLSTHPTTIEITKEKFLTKRGNCIISVGSNKSVQDYSPELKDAIRQSKKILVKLQAGPHTDEFMGYGHENLSLSNEVSMVFRVSTFLSDRTALILCSKASHQLNPDLVAYLQDPTHELFTTFFVIDE